MNTNTLTECIGRVPVVGLRGLAKGFAYPISDDTRPINNRLKVKPDQQ